MTTGQRIKIARKKAGLTQAELAQKLDIPFQSISQWERDIRNPKITTLQRIATALDVSINYLLGNEDMDGFLLPDNLDPDDYAFIAALGFHDPQRRQTLFNVPDAQTAEQQEAASIINRITEELKRSGPFRKLSDSEMEKSGFLQFPSDEARLAYFYSKLNDEGKRVAADRIQELSEIPKYQKDKEPPQPE